MQLPNTFLKERISRIKSAVALKEHDKVPIVGNLGFWPVKHQKKYTMQEAFYSVEVFRDSYEYALSKWDQWDALIGSVQANGPRLNAIGSKRYIIPGIQISPYSDYQHPDHTLMTADDYDKFIEDPIKFQYEEILPKICSQIKPESLYTTVKAVAKAINYSNELKEETAKCWSDWEEKYSIPLLAKNVFLTPIDWIADSLRGFNQGLIDVKIRPDKIKAAGDALLPYILNVTLQNVPAGTDFPFLYNPQHVSPFISPKDYEKVYWPSFKKMVDIMTERGHTVWTVFEGAQDQHLERLQDLPHGRFVAHFEGTDLKKAKWYLGGKICIAGGMPNSLLAKGTPADVEAQAKSVLKLFGDEPGFIMAADGGLNAAKPENIDAWLKTVEEYGNLNGMLEMIDDEQLITSFKDNLDVTKAITTWDSVKHEFGEIKGDEEIIKKSWEELEVSTLNLLGMLLR